jgi:O-acetyl-ADP-ribose deacetylase (regulator of RNase III)
MTGLEERLGDITTVETDAIVNAANERLLGGDGVDGAIHAAAGRELLNACRDIPEVRPGVRCPTGEARVTPGFRLPARLVIHTVGPVWHGGHQDERELLAKCYRSILEACATHDVRSLAVPAISCGIYRFPVDEAARIAVHEMSRAPENLLDSVVFVAFDDAIHRALTSAVRASQGPTSTTPRA